MIIRGNFLLHQNIADVITQLPSKRRQIIYARTEKIYTESTNNYRGSIESGIQQAQETGEASTEKLRNEEGKLVAEWHLISGMANPAANVVVFSELNWDPNRLIVAENIAFHFVQRDFALEKYLIAKKLLIS